MACCEDRDGMDRLLEQSPGDAARVADKAI